VWLHLSVQTVRALDSLLALFQKAIATEVTALKKLQLALTVMVAHEAEADRREVETQYAMDQAGEP